MGKKKNKTIKIIFASVAVCITTTAPALFYTWENQAETLYRTLGSSNTVEHNRERDAFLHAYLSARLSQITNSSIAFAFGNLRENYQDNIRLNNYGGPQDRYNNEQASKKYEHRVAISPFKADIKLAKDILKKIDNNEFVLSLDDPRLLTIKASYKNSKNFVTRPL